MSFGWKELYVDSGVRYQQPPRFDVTLEDFEICALDRLRVLTEIESSMARNRTHEEMQSITLNQCNKYLPLHSNTALAVDRDLERKRDHVSHFVLRLAFCRSSVASDLPAQPKFIHVLEKS